MSTMAAAGINMEEPLTQVGGSSRNLETVLYNNVASSLYYTEMLREIVQVNEIVDIIYEEVRIQPCASLSYCGHCTRADTLFQLEGKYFCMENASGKAPNIRIRLVSNFSQVTNVEPWMSGNARGPSTAFCCLFKLCDLKPTGKEIRSMLSHRDSPFIRAVRPMICIAAFAA